MKNLLTIILVLFSTCCMGQWNLDLYVDAEYGIIDDPDGFTNVRSEAHADAPIIYTVREAEVFEYFLNIDDEEEKWVQVGIPANKFSLGADLNDASYLYGYIHRSRIKPLKDLKDCPASELDIKFEIQAFDSSRHVIEQKRGLLIDGRQVWGTDGVFPRTQVKKIQVILKGNHIPVHEVFYGDLFECRNDFKIKKDKETYFVHQSNSDGAGSYQVIWVLNRSGIKQRIVIFSAG